jgi:transposase
VASKVPPRRFVVTASGENSTRKNPPDASIRSRFLDYALLQLDQAGAHVTAKLSWPENIIPVLQPAHCPQLNPIERLWQAIKSQLKGESFSSLDDLRSRLQQVIHSLTPQQISSVTAYDFILEALFYAASS